MLDFRVKTFLTVCETMNFTRAADRLHVTQPAVSQHIRYLEKEYQVKLFRYQGKKLTLTAAGEKLRQAMRQMQSDERLLKAEIKQADLPPVRFGVTMTIGEYALARPLSRFLKDHPQTNVEVVYGNTQFLTKKLDEGDLDFALVEGDPARGYASMRYQSEDFIAVCSPDLSFAKEPDQIADLFDQRLLVREPGSGTRKIMEDSLGAQGQELSDFKQYVQVGNMQMITQLLLANCGVSFLYQTAVSDLLKAGKLRKLSLRDFQVRHDFTFIWEKNSLYADRHQQICAELKASR